MSAVLWAPNKPKHWDGASLRWVADIFAGGTPDKGNLGYWTDGTIPWLNSGSVGDWIINEPSMYITKDAYSNSSAKWIPSRSVVIALAGQGKTKGTAARLEIDSTCNQSMAAIVPSNSLDYRFLQFWLASNYQNIRNLAGGDKRDGLNLAHIGGIQVPLPPVDEQRSISDYLDRETQKIDELITEQRGLIETLRERRIAVISKAVRSGLDPAVENRPSGVDWLGNVPSHWDVKRLKYSIESALPGVWGSDPIGDGSDVRCVRVADFDRPHLRVGESINTMRSIKSKDIDSRKLQQGDLLIEKSGGTSVNPVGFVAIYDGDGETTVYANFIARMRPADGQNSRYWLYVHAASYSTRLTLRSVKQTTGIQNLDQSSYFDELFPYPPVEEQKDISEYLDERTSRIDELIAESEDLITLSQERRAALITAAVTGQIDVRTAS
ncbi:restriction endonuclease subunit S [Corynebacterium variabile]|uniref:restriction endonuclease subunit S n=1 Tax=Corynebacterium variabile TaxID=1727 RepID=UPI003FD3954D